MTLTRTTKFMGGLSADLRNIIHADNANASFGIGIEDSINANLHIRNNTGDNVLKLETTDAAALPVLVEMFKNSGSPADNDNVASIVYTANSDNDTTRAIYTTHIQVADVTDGSEDFILNNYAIIGGVSVPIDTYNSSKYEFNSNQLDIDFIVNGNTNADLLYVDAGSERVGIGTSSPDAKLEIVNPVNDVTDVILTQEASTASDFGPEIVFRRTKTGASGDLNGRLSFQALDDGNVNRNLGDIYAELDDATSGTYAGRLFIRVFESSKGIVTAFDISDVIIAVNSGADDTDFRITTPSQTNRFYVNSGTDSVGIGTNAPGQKLDVEDGNVQLSTNNTGIHLNSAGGTRYFVYVDNAGNLQTEAQ